MPENEEKAREQRLRRRAERQGLILRKSRARNSQAPDYGTYWLLDAHTDNVVAGDTRTGFGLDLDAVERALE